MEGTCVGFYEVPGLMPVNNMTSPMSLGHMFTSDEEMARQPQEGVSGTGQQSKRARQKNGHDKTVNVGNNNSKRRLRHEIW